MRKRRGRTQAKLATEAVVSQSLIAKIEGGRMDPWYSCIKKIVSALEKLPEGEEGIAAKTIGNRPVVSVNRGDLVTDALKPVEVDLNRSFQFWNVVRWWAA